MLLLLVGYGNLWVGGRHVAAVTLTLAYLVVVPMAIWFRAPANTVGRAVELDRPPYVWAAVLGGGILALYAATLAPETGLWDSSEFIAAANEFGIPHPPGSPLWVVVAHAFGLLPLPVGYAARINLLSAASSAAAASVWFLIAHRSLRALRLPEPVRRAAAAAAVWSGATLFTIWNQSVLSEKVYSFGVLLMAGVVWSLVRWLDTDADDNQRNGWMWLAVYGCALGFTVHTAGLLPAPVVGVAALVDRIRNGRWGFAPRHAPLVALLVAIGVSPYLTQPIRASYHPFLNTGNPSGCSDGPHLDCLLSKTTADRVRVGMAREEYGGHSVLDRHAPMRVQVALWWDYFTWQWWRDSYGRHPRSQQLLACGWLLLLLLGAWAAYRSRDPVQLVIGALVIVTTPLLVWYLNLAYGPNQQIGLGSTVAREGADRDYFFVWSFAPLCLWIGPGLAQVWQWLAKRLQRVARWRAPIEDGRTRIDTRSWLWASPLLLIASAPAFLNYPAAARNGDRLPLDWAADLLMSLEPYGVLISNGENDTYPLWYAQQVRGIRKDVRVILAPYLRTDWYPRQLRIRRVRRYKGDGLPEYAAMSRPFPTHAPIVLSDSQLDGIPQVFEVGSLREFVNGQLHATIKPDSLSRDQLLLLHIIRDNSVERPIYFSVGQYAQQLGLGDYVITQGLVQRLLDRPAREFPGGVSYPGGYLDVERTQALWTHYRGQHTLLNAATWANTIPSGIPVVYDVTAQLLAYGLAQRGDTAGAKRVLDESAGMISALATLPSPALRPKR